MGNRWTSNSDKLGKMGGDGFRQLRSESDIMATGTINLYFQGKECRLRWTASFFKLTSGYCFGTPIAEFRSALLLCMQFQ